MSVNFGDKGKFQRPINPLSELLAKKQAEAAEAARLAALDAAKQLAASSSNSSGGAGAGLVNKTCQPIQKEIEYVSAEKVKDRIVILFDDSGSMIASKMQDAIDGCIEFLRNCGFNQTAVRIVPLCSNLFKSDDLTTNLPSLAVKVKMLRGTGNTPLYTKWATAISSEVTRYVIFSDGQPDYAPTAKENNINFCIKHKIPCDTVLIWDPSSYSSQIDVRETSQYRELKEIADKTGGIFMVFERGKVNFKTAFKYLAPVHRLALAASTHMQKDLQEGRLI